MIPEHGSKHTNLLRRLLAIMVFDHTSLNMTFPILTLLFFDVHSRLFSPDASQSARSIAYGLCVATPHLVVLFAAPIQSALSDHYGRRRLLAIGTLGAFVFAITTALGVLWGSLSLVFLGRAIQGLFSKTNPIAQAVIGDIAPPEKKVVYMGYLQLSIALGAFIGPVVGGYFARHFLFDTLNFSPPYFIATLFALSAFILTLFYFTETLPTSFQSKKVGDNFRSFLTLLKQPEILSLSLLLAFSQFSWSLYYQYMPPLLKTHFHFEASAIGLFVGLIALWIVVGSSLGIKCMARITSTTRMTVYSLWMILVGLCVTLAAIFFSDNHLLLWLGAVPTAIGDVINYICITTLYSQAAGAHSQGKIMGLCFIIVSSLWAFTGFLGGFLASLHALLPISVAPLGILLALFIRFNKTITN